MKNIIKTLVIIGTLLQGGLAFADDLTLFSNSGPGKSFVVEFIGSTGGGNCANQDPFSGQLNCYFYESFNFSIKISNKHNNETCELTWLSSAFQFTTNCPHSTLKPIHNTRPTYTFELL